ncbi:MAG: hypothetical protein EOO20_21935 [Chryseobacterium sp.]|nr:MAG: hypothetical protein EOO20_21935 [Chryseobacterium sp.]
MKIEISMLIVKDGDAIIIELSKMENSLVMVVDSGHTAFYTNTLKPKLSEIFKKHKKTAPDVVVCTHYDSDHIARLIPLIKDYIKDIKQVRVHKTPQAVLEHISVAKNMLIEEQVKADQKSTSELLLDSLKLNGHEDEHNKAKEILLESLPELQRFLGLIPEEKRKHVFAGEKPLEDWPEITILGPTQAYFDTLFTSQQTLKEFLEQEATKSIIVPLIYSRNMGACRNYSM